MNKLLLNRILILAIIALIIFISILYIKILLPFFVGAFLAYLLNPLVNVIASKNISRNFGAIIVLIIFLSFITIFSLSILPIIIQQTFEFLDKFPDLLKKLEEYFSKLSNILKKYAINFDYINFIKDFHSSLGSVIKNLVSKLLFSSIAIINIFSFILLTPIVTWYFLKDWENIKMFFINNIPKKYQKKISQNLCEVDKILACFIRGQSIVSLILGCYYFLAFYIIGADYAIFLGLSSGILSLIPYFGILVSFFISSYIIVLQFANIYYIFIIFLIFIVSFLLEGYFLSPKIIGEKLGLHPLAILYSVFIFGSILGFVGVFFAIPFSCIIFLYYKKILKNMNKEFKR